MGSRVTPAAVVEGVVVNVTESRLRGIQNQIGCRVVDVVRLVDGIDGWIDDEGLYTQDRNDLATVIATLLGRSTKRFRSCPREAPPNLYRTR